MSSESQTNFDTITEELQQDYAALLLQIVQELEQDRVEELRLYCTAAGLIPKEITGAVNIIFELDRIGKISWKNVSFLKGSLNRVFRLDLVKTLLEFENKRNMILLMNLYAKKRNGLETNGRFSSSVESLSECLVKVIAMETTPGRFDDLSDIRSSLESTEGIKRVLSEFEKEIEAELSHRWSKLTLLVIIAAEIIFEVLGHEEHRRKLDVMKLCFTAADELCFRMKNLGSWVSLNMTLVKLFVYLYLGKAQALTSIINSQNEPTKPTTYIL